MDGEIINMFIYDVGVALPFEKVRNLLKNPEDFSKLEYNTPAPEEIPTFSVPYIFNLRDREITVGGKSAKLKLQVAIYELGAFSIRARMKMDGADEKLWSEVAFSKRVLEDLGLIAAKVRREVEGNLSKVADIRTEGVTEMYTFYFINGTKDQILKGNRSLIAGMLVDEKDPAELDKEYMDEVLDKNISYNFDDAFFIGWEGSVLIDKLKSYDTELLIAEIANVQLLKLRAIRNKISSELLLTSREVKEIHDMGLLKRLYSGRPAKLSQTLGEFSDGVLEMMNKLENTAFGLGEWYLARLYVLFSNVFKLHALGASIKSDIQIIGRRKGIADAAVERKHADTLEVVVILLIVLEVVLEVLFIMK